MSGLDTIFRRKVPWRLTLNPIQDLRTGSIVPQTLVEIFPLSARHPLEFFQEKRVAGEQFSGLDSFEEFIELPRSPAIHGIHDFRLLDF